MNSWAVIAKKNRTNSSDEKKELHPNLENTINLNGFNDMQLIKNKHISSLSDIFNTVLDKLNNGYFTILTIDNNSRRDHFINMMLNNFNINYHMKYDNFNSDSDINEINNSEEDEFVPTYSKFAYQ